MEDGRYCWLETESKALVAARSGEVEIGGQRVLAMGAKRVDYNKGAAG